MIFFTKMYLYLFKIFFSFLIDFLSQEINDKSYKITPKITKKAWQLNKCLSFIKYNI